MRYYDMLKVQFAPEDDPSVLLQVDDASQEVCPRLVKALIVLRSATANKAMGSPYFCFEFLSSWYDERPPPHCQCPRRRP